MFRRGMTDVVRIWPGMNDGSRGEPSGLPDDVLIVEDDPLIALDAVELLHGFGVQSVRMAATAARALEMLQDRVPDFTLLDVALSGEKSFAVADWLATLGSPFAFMTGYAEKSVFPPRFAGRPMLHKPYRKDELLTLLKNWRGAH